MVDDKLAPLRWAFAAASACGYSEDRVLEARYGDDALEVYERALKDGVVIDAIVSDYHMDVTKRPPQGIQGQSFSAARILSGVELAGHVFKIDPNQKFCLVSAGLDALIKKQAEAMGIELIMHKRRPKDPQFAEYTERLSAYIDRGL